MKVVPSLPCFFFLISKIFFSINYFWWLDSWPDFVNLKNDIVSGKGRYIGSAVSNIFQGLFVKMKITENRIIFIFKCQKKDFCKFWLLNWIESYFETNAILYLCIKRNKKKTWFQVTYENERMWFLKKNILHVCLQMKQKKYWYHTRQTHS